jgi:signal transduction histidine kinase
VRTTRFGQHRTLLFRAYLFLVAGLLIVAALLDLGFGYLQSELGARNDPWLDSSLKLIETQLAEAAPEQRDQVAQELSEASGIDIKLLGRDDIAVTTDSEGPINTLVDADGNETWLYDAPQIDALIYLDPPDAPNESLVLNLLPPLFYLSIFVVVGIWLSPLLKDLNLITSAADRFAADYREPLATADKTTQLTSLARNLDDMSTRLSGLIQSQKELIAALSHEMRTPLARIRFALAVIGNDGNEELKKQLDEMNNDVQEIDDLIATILSYARLDHPDLSMNWQDVPVEAWLRELKDKIHLPGKTLEIDCKVNTIRMDPNLMGLALNNLLSNAGRYADNKIMCLIKSDNGSQCIAVHDDGKGIPEEERRTVFKAFTRLDDSRNRETGGYGLGLAIVSRIAELHGGAVTADSSAKLGGAKFTLSWPRAAVSL